MVKVAIVIKVVIGTIVVLIVAVVAGRGGLARDQIMVVGLRLHY